MGLAYWIYQHMGDTRASWDTPSPPGSCRDLSFGPPEGDGTPLYRAVAGNDGFELWIGYDDRWLFHCRQSDARRLAWFIVWTCWAKGTWFGLRRWIWYRALKAVNRSSLRRHESQGSPIR